LSKNISKDFNINSFWGHSIATSVISREIAKNLGYKILAESFVAGLVHDLGILILNQYFSKEFDEVVQLSKTNNIPITEAEMKVIGVTHDEVGSWLAQRWNFPKQLIESMRYHHNPSFAVINKQLAAIVHFAEFLALRIKSCDFPLEKGINFKASALPLLNYKDASYLDTFFEVYNKTIEEEIAKIKNFVAQ
jgi:putative nucleotidyltransferase with HDIG domain